MLVDPHFFKLADVFRNGNILISCLFIFCDFDFLHQNDELIRSSRIDWYEQYSKPRLIQIFAKTG